MKKYIPAFIIGGYMFFCMLTALPAPAQGALPIQRYTVSPAKNLLDKVTTPSSFAYSLRKIKRGYAGYALKLRRGSGTASAEGDVSFDASGMVSSNSSVTVTTAGLLSGLLPGQVLTLSSFKGSQAVYVKTWYDQGANVYNATQNTTSSQPELVLNSAGASNNKPSVVFTGAEYLEVAQPIENLVNNGINGTFMLWTKPTANSGQSSFGYQGGNDYRWAMHFNWTDGKLYFDAGEICCGATRSFDNSSNLNLFKQYSFIRGSTYKTVRINSASTPLNNSSATATTTATGGSFYIGWAANGASQKYQGNLCEVVLFRNDLATSSLQLLETDQITFWSN